MGHVFRNVNFITSITDLGGVQKRSYQQLAHTALSPAPTQNATPLPQGRTTHNFNYSVVLEEPIKTIML